MKMDSKFEDDMEMSYEEGHGHHYAKDRDKKSKVMTMEDVADNLSKDLMDEIEDCKKYFCMSKVAEKSNNHEDCYYLLEMSKDEFTHAYFIHSFMIEHDIAIPEEQEKEFEHLKNKMKEFFQ